MQVDDFLQALVNFDKEHIPEATVRSVKDEYLSDPEFNPEFVRQKSSAAAGLCAWVINIIRFHEVHRLSRSVSASLAYTLFLRRCFSSLIVVSFFSIHLILWADICKYTTPSLTASSCSSRVIRVFVNEHFLRGSPGTLRGGDEEDVSVSG